jgi:hypothetical protein
MSSLPNKTENPETISEIRRLCHDARLYDVERWRAELRKRRPNNQLASDTF